MSWNGSGLFNIDSTGQPVSANTLIESADFNALTADLATGLSNCVTKDGQQTITANLPMAGFRHTGVGNAVARTDYAAAGQVQDGKLNWVDGGGTADAITATYSPAITALVDGQMCCVRATAANATTTPTFSPNGLTARTIVKKGGAALVAGDIVADGHELILRYDLANTRWELMNPVISINDSPQFAGINLGHASDTTLTRVSAGVVAVEGTNVVLAGAVTTDGITMSTARLLGRTTASTGAVEEITVGSGLSLSAGALTATGGKIVQVVEGTPYTTYSSTATAIPADDSIPQNTEGAEWATVTITPTSATNRLRIEAHIPTINASTTVVLTAALFQDSTANALSASAQYTSGNGYYENMTVVYEMAAGTTSSTTFKLRAGPSAGVMYVNGDGSARKLGGTIGIRIRVTEIAI